ncbi:hypothetical protein CAEBREN_07521 [Caenorhabditis brenneri]|uniref:Uncharacterized protein n=1 Tax=Caenorhabditis brenneri TaxID=135651 RepID=G0NV39_CAEBE|nr:hypothetical protein CAEBREN_07521 [Caenorhabditis brenneri]
MLTREVKADQFEHEEEQIGCLVNGGFDGNFDAGRNVAEHGFLVVDGFGQQMDLANQFEHEEEQDEFYVRDGSGPLLKITDHTGQLEGSQGSTFSGLFAGPHGYTRSTKDRHDGVRCETVPQETTRTKVIDSMELWKSMLTTTKRTGMASLKKFAKPTFPNNLVFLSPSIL